MTDALSLARTIDEQACLSTLSEMVQVQESLRYRRRARALAARMVEIMSEMGARGAFAARRGRPCQRHRRLWRGTGGGKSLLFNGHLDTNPVSEGWNRRSLGRARRRQVHLRDRRVEHEGGAMPHRSARFVR